MFDLVIVMLTWANVHWYKSLNRNRPQDLTSLIVRDGESALHIGEDM